MYTGTVKWFNYEKKFGFIDVEGQKDDAFLHLSQVKHIPQTITDGMSLCFEIEKTDRGINAVKVRLEGLQQTETITENKQAVMQEKVKLIKADTFHNPYNFVRFLGKSEVESDLNRRKPPSLIADQKLNGSIKVNLICQTPLSVLGKKTEEPVSNGNHPTYEFLKLKDEYIIPGSSLKGMIRSVYEAVTNSCFSILEENDKEEHVQPLFYRGSAKNVVPARIIQNEEDTFSIELLTGNHKRLDTKAQYAAWVFRYNKSNVGVNSLSKKYIGNQYKGRFKNGPIIYAIDENNNQQKLIHKNLYYVRLEHVDYEKEQTNKRGKISITKFSFMSVVDVLTYEKPGYVPAYYCETGYDDNPNSQNKHDERFFYRDKTVIADFPFMIDLEKQIVDRYKALLQNYVDVHYDKNDKEKNKTKTAIKNAVHSRHIQKKETTISNGDLVYVQLSADMLNVLEIYPVSLSRKQYKKSVMAFLDNHVKKCKSYDELCPACRLFGWIKSNEELEKVQEIVPSMIQEKAMEKPKETEKAEKTSYKSRVQLSNATLINKNLKPKKLILRSLGEPKPTAIPFYLKPKKGNELKESHNYDSNEVEIRGRKMYLDHQGQNGDLLYNELSDKTKIMKSKFNSTVEAFEPEVEFSFDIKFSNLSKEELGALLWTIKLDEGLNHHLGYGKPLGLGSVKFSVSSLGIEDSVFNQYSTYTSTDLIEKVETMDTYVDNFKKELTKVYGPFDTLDNIIDLKAILGCNVEVPIQYPPGQSGDDFDSNYEWFQKNLFKVYKNILPQAEDINNETGLPKYIR